MEEEWPDVEPNVSAQDVSNAKLFIAQFGLPNFSGADLFLAKLIKGQIGEADLSKADLSKTDLRTVDFIGTDLSGADLHETDFRDAKLNFAKLIGADLRGADLRGSMLFSAVLAYADLGEADLSKADLAMAALVKTNLERANLTACSVYGISAWDVRLTGAIQSNLVITPRGESIIQVDDLEVAQLIYLLLNNAKIRQVIDTIGKKAVLILGRFTPERKAVLNAIREELRKRDYLPVLFDFDPASSQTTMDTISTLAHMSRFIIADLTNAQSILGELERITTALQMVPVQLILHRSADIPPMGDSFLVRQSVLKPYYYLTHEELIASIAQVIAPAADKAEKFRDRLAEIRKQYLPWQQPL